MRHHGWTSAFDPHAARAWALLTTPMAGLKLLVWLGIGYYTAAQFSGDVVMAALLCGALLLIARWRVAGVAVWPLALLVYSATLLVEVAEAISFYFQAGSFNDRFFANVRIGNLRSGLDAFPGLFAGAALLLLAAIAGAGWLLARQRRVAAAVSHETTWIRFALASVLVVMSVLVPSAWHRLAGAIALGNTDAAVTSPGARSVAASLGTGTDPDAVRADPGKNLVIVYMESLERIYTDDKIFPGLTPNLNRWRARGLDFPGFLTFTGASYTMAGLFASQCGVPFFTTPSQVLDFTGNDANATSFQPGLACLGDVLHAAGYRQVFMNGAPLSFADQGAFFRLHGFDEVLGLDRLEAASGGAPLKTPGWGLYDSDLVRLASAKFDHLAAAGKPFNLDVLTIDNHPPRGRPSPGCPQYAANDNSTLQSVHCTDYLVGRFLDAISRSPAWKNTIVVVMSDHLSMRNDAWPLYPKTYKRRPLLFILNAGQGRRDMRFYHMDIAPTVLRLMGVATNVGFIAGADRSAADAPGSTLVNDPLDAAVLRHAVWQRAQPIAFCRGGTLVGPAPDGFEVGGVDVRMSSGGERLVGIGSGQELALLMGRSSVVSVVGDASRISAVLGAHASPALLIRPLPGLDPLRQFSLTWVGTRGARAALGDVPRLLGLQVDAEGCAQALQRVNAAPAGRNFDLRGRFVLRTAPLYPPLPQELSLATPAIRPFQRGLGWFAPPSGSGSWAEGDAASLGFTLPANACQAARIEFSVRPFFAPSRPMLAVKVLANGRLMTTWRFRPEQSGQIVSVVTPITGAGHACHVDLRFEFERPGAALPPYPAGEDPRPLQMEFKSMRLVPSAPQTGALPQG